MTPHDESVLSEFWAWQEGQRLSKRTIEERDRVLRTLIDYTKSSALTITPEGIMAFVARPEIVANSAGTYHASIRAYCKWLVFTDRRLDDPTAKTPTPKRVRGRPRPISDADLVGLLAVVKRRRTRMMILLAALAGLRVHEVAKFRGEDLDRHNETLTVTGKGGSTQLIPAHEAIVAEAAHFPREGYWFASYDKQSPRAGHVTRSAVYAAISAAMKRAGIQGTPHMLRHWYGTALLDAGVDIRVVQEMMRHALLSTTQLYTHVRFARLREAARLLTLPKAG